MANAEHQGIVVGIYPGFEVGAWSENLDRHFTKLPPATQLVGTKQANTSSAGYSQQSRILRACSLGLALASVPQFTNLDALDDAGQPSEVVGVRVRKHHDVEPCATTRSEDGHYDASARVHRRANEAATVHEHQLAVG
jgi:hypothetical protein